MPLTSSGGAIIGKFSEATRLPCRPAICHSVSHWMSMALYKVKYTSSP